MKSIANENLDRLLAMPKVDAHVHLLTAEAADGDALARLMERDAMRWLDICWYASDESLRAQVEAAQRMRARVPGRFAWVTAFSLHGFFDPGWADRATAAVDAGRAAGAVGVKVWKNIGMELRDAAGAYIMIDDPRLDPVLDHIEKTGMTLAAHIGEPRNCWLPLEEMNNGGDREYFETHPQYHGLLHPEIPGYWAQVNARDRMLERHPGLRVVGCHFGSTEFDVAEMARRLDRFPRLALDMSARVCHLQVQDRDTVREFLVRYQDRILYGTDAVLAAGGADRQLDELDGVYSADCRYFATDGIVDSPIVAPGFQCRGLALPLPVLEKLFHGNALAWYPGCAL
jgi:predicted TIM-barrel fold metal-dependent hydrolase